MSHHTVGSRLAAGAVAACLVLFLGSPPSWSSSPSSSLSSSPPPSSSWAEPAAPAACAEAPFALPANLPAVEEHYQLSDEARQTLARQGFVALPDAGVDALSTAYFGLFSDRQVSVVITSDAALHLFHNVFDGMLAEIERQHLMAEVTDLVGRLQADCAAMAAAGPEPPLLSDAARHNAIVFAVAARLLDPDFEIPSDLQPEAGDHVRKVLEHSVTEVFPGDDYTVYAPRGHYAGDAELETYFRVVKWLGRRIYRIEDRYYPAEADVELVAAAGLARALAHDPDARAAWDRVTDVTGLLVGHADSITPVQMMRALEAVFGSDFDPAVLDDAAARARLRAELAKDDYPTSEIIPVPLAFPDQIPGKYVQVMGELYLPDAHLMQLATFPGVPDRLLPSGLDVMAAVLGSDRAAAWLADDMAAHPGLEAAIARERSIYDARGESWWRKSAYNGWLHGLRPLLAAVPTTAPGFARGPAWQDKQLNTAMASWTQLRHDIILYGKQTTVPMPYAEGPGLVEPVPDTFGRLADLCDQLQRQLEARGMLPPTYARALVELRQHLAEWELYGGKVAAGQALTDEEQGYVHRTGLWLLELFARPGEVAEKSPRLVADVAADSNTGRVLHEGTGGFRPLIVVYTPPGGRPIGGIGFAFSQYEFVERDWNRLTDRQWLERLATDPPQDPPWVASMLPSADGGDRTALFLPLAEALARDQANGAGAQHDGYDHGQMRPGW